MIEVGVALYRRDFPGVESSATPSLLLFSFHSYDFTTLSLFLYPRQTRSFFSLYFPLSHKSRTRRNSLRPSFNDSVMVHAYCYCYCWRTLVDLNDLPRTHHMNSGALTSLHSHWGLPGPSDKVSKDKRQLPSSSDRGTEISSVQPSPSKAPLQRCLINHAERSPLLSRTLTSNNLLTSLGFKKTSRLLAEETWRITTRSPAS